MHIKVRHERKNKKNEIIGKNFEIFIHCYMHNILIILYYIMNEKVNKKWFSFFVSFSLITITLLLFLLLCFVYSLKIIFNSDAFIPLSFNEIRFK